ncbi:Peptidase A2 domain-containing protein [Candidatus Magnetomoraceae bacterium gMMP-15]
MNFKWKHNLIWIPLTIVYDGKLIQIENCLLDTGSATTAVDIDLIDNFNYNKPSKIKRLCGIGGGVQEVICQQIDKIIIDQFELNTVEIEFGDISADLGIHGFLGNDILSKFNFAINFNKLKINFLANKYRKEK